MQDVVQCKLLRWLKNGQNDISEAVHKIKG